MRFCSFQEIFRSAKRDSYIMFIRAILAFLVLAMIICQAAAPHSKLRYEIPCLHEGGVCVHDSECPFQFRYNTSSPLCERQSPQGAVCCSKMPDAWKICSQRGGECFPPGKCSKYGIIDPKGECTDNWQCCQYLQFIH